MRKQTTVMIAVLAVAAITVVALSVSVGPYTPESAVREFLSAVEEGKADEVATRLTFATEPSNRNWSDGIGRVLEKELAGKLDSASLKVWRIGRSGDGTVEVGVSPRGGGEPVVFCLKKVEARWQIVDCRSGELEDILAVWHQFRSAMAGGDLASAKKCISSSFALSGDARSLKLIEISCQLESDRSAVFCFGTEGTLVFAIEDAAAGEPRLLTARFVREEGQWRIQQISLERPVQSVTPKT